MFLTEFQRCFYVPQGYVAIVRSVTVLIMPPADMALNDGWLEILVNGAAVDPPDVEIAGGGGLVDFFQDTIPFRDGEPVETFVLADQGATIGVQLEVPDDFPGVQASTIKVGFRGQFLLKTGVPAQFQAANEAGRARHAVTSGKNDLALSSGEGLTVRRRQKVAFPGVPILRGK